MTAYTMQQQRLVTSQTGSSVIAGGTTVGRAFGVDLQALGLPSGSTATIGKFWFLSPGNTTPATTLPGQIAIYDVTSGTPVLVTNSQVTSPTWSGAAASGWVSYTYATPPTVTDGHWYMAAVAGSSSSGVWVALGSATGGWPSSSTPGSTSVGTAPPWIAGGDYSTGPFIIPKDPFTDAAGYGSAVTASDSRNATVAVNSVTFPNSVTFSPTGSSFGVDVEMEVTLPSGGGAFGIGITPSATGLRTVVGHGSFSVAPTLAATGVSGTFVQGHAQFAVQPSAGATGVQTVFVKGNGLFKPAPSLAAAGTATIHAHANFSIVLSNTLDHLQPGQLTNFYFSPPAGRLIPPFPIADGRRAPSTAVANPLGMALLKYYQPMPAGVNVFILFDGTVLIDQLPDGWPNRSPMIVDPTTGLYPTAQIGQPWPAEPILQNSQGYISQSWVGGIYTPTTQGIMQPIEYMFHGGHANGPLSYGAYQALRAANFGGYITLGPPPATMPPA